MYVFETSLLHWVCLYIVKILPVGSMDCGPGTIRLVVNLVLLPICFEPEEFDSSGQCIVDRIVEIYNTASIAADFLEETSVTLFGFVIVWRRPASVGIPKANIPIYTSGTVSATFVIAARRKRSLH